MTQPPFNIAQAFHNKEDAMRASHLAIRNVTTHSTTIGDRSEADWVGLIQDFLPTRYTVGPIFAVDYHGNMSEQIDTAIYDTHFSPQWFGAANGIRFVPVESVYAVFEVKPRFSTKYVRYARGKVASVRRLERTCGSVTHKGGEYAANEIRRSPIIGGILTTSGQLKSPVEMLKRIQKSPEEDSFLNIGICLDQFAFDYTPTPTPNGVESVLNHCSTKSRLIYFCIRLFRQLQSVGSVPAVDMAKYEERVSSSFLVDESEQS